MMLTYTLLNHKYAFVFVYYYWERERTTPIYIKMCSRIKKIFLKKHWKKEYYNYFFTTQTHWWRIKEEDEPPHILLIFNSIRKTKKMREQKNACNKIYLAAENLFIAKGIILRGNSTYSFDSNLFAHNLDNYKLITLLIG